MNANYFNRRKAQIKNRDTGYDNKLYFAAREDFDVIAEPEAPFTKPGDNKTIKGDHEFLDDNGFIELMASPETVEANGETGGEIGSKKMMWSPVGFLPGDGADVQALAEAMLNDDGILILEDANCPGGPQVQFGCKCNPVRVESVAFTSGTTATEGRKGYLITFASTCRFIYEGAIVTLADPVGG